MRVYKWFWAMTLLALATTGEAVADPRSITALGEGMPQPGQSLDDVRALKVIAASKMICDTDADKPKLSEPRLMDNPHRGSDHVRRCALFAKGADGGWDLASIPTLAGPARLWLTFVEQGGGGRYRLAQLSLWAKMGGWDKVAKTLSEIQGPAAAGSDRYLSWQDEQHEILMFVDEKKPDEFAVAIGDLRLRRLIRSPGTSNRLE